MAYKALYRKYRPRTFDEVVGQEHITETLKHQVMANSVSHAYLFTGSRGTGKTSTAKIFAKAVNCPHSKNGSPCFECDVCKALDSESNVDILEIDAASNNRVDEIRDIREKVKFLPVNGKYKVYIIDEVHMLTDQAFNALLKTLEEPPEHIIFILATTEVHKLPATILSRCMRFDFRLVPVPTLMNLVKKVFASENITCEEEALKLIALAGEGSCRDTLSLADCVSAFAQGKITVETAQKVLGTSGTNEYVKLFDAINQKQVGSALEILQENFDNGKNMTVFAKDLTLHARNLLVMQNCQKGENLIPLSTEALAKLKIQAQNIPADDLMEYMKIFSSIEAEMKYALSPKTLLETAVITAVSEVGEGQKKNELN
ncbi:MAG: DNA polymerase III subunit gamma/tau [Clostridiales bacterium]|nr:DNA polymerase III subunit gamma/tau [Clostridiales bacterium]